MTVDHEHLELIQAELDGELGGPSRAELARYLLAHPEARAERDALASVCAELAKVPREEPPPELCTSIMAALPPQRRTVPAAAGRGGSLRAFRIRPTTLRFAAGLAGAALVATLAYQLGSTRGPLLSNDLVGTMAPAAREDGQAAEIGPARDEARIQLEQFSAVVTLHGTRTTPLVRVAIQSGGGLELVARAGDQEIQLAGATVRPAAQRSPAAEFRPFAQPGIGAVEVDVVDPASGAVLQRTTLSFEGR